MRHTRMPTLSREEAERKLAWWSAGTKSGVETGQLSLFTFTPHMKSAPSRTYWGAIYTVKVAGQALGVPRGVVILFRDSRGVQSRTYEWPSNRLVSLDPLESLAVIQSLSKRGKS